MKVKLMEECYKPKQAYNGDALDLKARSLIPLTDVLGDEAEEGEEVFLEFSDHYMLSPGKRVMIKTGIFTELDIGEEIGVTPRSGLAKKYGVTVLNTPGKVDPTYRGELCVLMINHGQESFKIEHCDRVAQISVYKTFNQDVEYVTELSETERGANGFGSTGKGE